MSEIVEATPIANAGLAPRRRDWRPVIAAAVVAAVYYAGARIGLAFTFEPFPLSVLWPPNALLFASLVLAPPRWWWLLILGAFPAHLLAELQGGVPAAMVLCWFVSNVTEAVIGATIVRRFCDQRRDLGTVRNVMAFGVAATVAPFLSSFLDAGFVRLIGWRDADYWSLVHARTFSNALATLVFVPVAMTWATSDATHLRQLAGPRLREAALLLVGLLTVSIIAFDSGMGGPDARASLLFLPVPFLLWAALRFGPPMTSAAFALVAFLVIAGAGHGHGPFLQAAAHENAFPIQLFLITVAVPMLLLAAVIEERRHAEQRLRASEDLFATAFRASPDAIAISRRRDGRIIEANARWLDLLGYERDALARGLIAPLAAHAQGGERQKLSDLERFGAVMGDVEVTLRDRRGQERQTLVRLNAVELQGEPCTIGIVRDITPQRQAELEAREQQRQLAHLTRVASLTDFSGTLAHELNQPLTAILANAQAALRFLAREPLDLKEIRAILGEIAEADKRAGRLIHHLRLLMKRGDEAFARLDLNQVVREVLDLLRGEFVVREVELRVSLSPGLPHPMGDPIQLQQVVLNLVSNACDAMQGQPADRRTLSITTLDRHDGSVQLVVSDTGPGIDAERLERVFEPFYTTKESGLGLGLAISRRIALSHGGRLTAERREGGGASMRLVLPAVRDTSAVAA
jgi:PAS domain S-box-containing protein